jgi:tRNA A-37 threonylcarbamoyl transferase component Bud32
MQSILQNIDYHVNNPVKVLKNDPTSTVVVVKIDDHLLVIKRSNTKDWFHVIRRFFALSRARKNWRNALVLKSYDISTFLPVAIVEERFGPLKGRSYLICSYIQGAEAIDYFASNESSAYQVATNIVQMIKNLAKHWVSHRDLNLSNIILIDGKPWLIDLDAMRKHRFWHFAHRGAKREIERFMINCRSTPGVSTATTNLFETIFNELENKPQLENE